MSIFSKKYSPPRPIYMENKKIPIPELPEDAEQADRPIVPILTVGHGGEAQANELPLGFTTAWDTSINPKEFMDVLQIEEAEFDLIKHPERGVCLYKCGNERYLLQVIAPEYKRKLFGEAGGR